MMATITVSTPVSSPNESESFPNSLIPFLTIWVGQLISVLGTGLTTFALGVWIFQQSGKVTPFALTVLFGSLPRLLLMPVAGSLADRWNRRRLMFLADLGSALTTLAAALILTFSTLHISQIYLLVIISSAFAAFQEPAFTASIAMIVPKKHLARANGLQQLTQAIEVIATPVIAGALFVVIGLNGILVVDFVTYFFALGALLLVRIPQPVIHREPGASRPSIWQDFVFGLSYLYKRTGLFWLLLYFALVNFLLNLVGVLMGPLVLSNHPVSVLGIVQTAAGAGMLVGSVVISTWGGPKRRRVHYLIGFIALAVLGMIVAGLGVNPLFLIVGYIFLLFFIPLASACSQTLFQTKVAPEVQGRVFSVRSMLSRSMMPLAFLIAGPLADRVFEPLMRLGGPLANTLLGSVIGFGPGRGIGLMFILAGLATLVVSLFAILNPHIRHIETELPDVV